MAIKKWVGSDGDANNASNYLPSGVPSAGDSLYFVPEFNGPVNRNLTALSAIALATVWWMPGNRSNVGGPMVGLVLDCDDLVFDGDGVVYVDQVTLTSTNFVLQGGSNSKYTFIGPASGTCAIWSGNVQLDTSSGVFDTLLIGTKPGKTPPIFRMTAGGDSWALWSVISGGTIYTMSPLTTNAGTCTIDGGLVHLLPEGTVAWPTPSTLVIAGGVMQWDAEVGAASGVEIYVSSGVLDMENDYRAKTLDMVYVAPTGDFRTHDSITVTNLYDHRPNFPILP